MLELISEYGPTVIGSILTGIVGFVGMAVKAIVKRKYEEEVKERVAEKVVCMVAQVYPDAPGEEKLEHATSAMSEMLMQKDISYTDLELRILIEAAVLKTGVDK